MFSKFSKLLLVTAGIVSTSYGYLEDNYKLDMTKPPSILPPPKKMTHGQSISVIDPCQFSLDKNNEFLKLGDNHVQNLYTLFSEKFLFPHQARDCSNPQSLKMPADTKVLRRLSLKINSGEIKELLSSSIHDMDESYTLTIHDN